MCGCLIKNNSQIVENNLIKISLKDSPKSIDQNLRNAIK